MMNEITGAILQVLLFTAIPFLVYLVSNKTSKNFMVSMGIKQPTLISIKYAVLLAIAYTIPLLICITINTSILEMVLSKDMVTGKIRQMGFSLNSVVSLFIIGTLNTALAEEIFFRGFIGKKLVGKLGYKTGNLLQAVIFGIVHLALVALATQNIMFLIISFIFPTLLGYFIMDLNEKYSDGSIVPGIITHGISNIIGYSFIGFVI